MKNGWDHTSPRPCGCTPRLLRAMDARETHPLDLQPVLATDIESVSWVTEDSLWDHEWITETKVTMKENLILEALHNDLEVTNFNRKFVNNGTKVKFRDTVSSAIELTCNIAFDGAHTSRECFLLAATIFLCYAPDRIGSWKKKCKGGAWGKIDLARLSAVRGSVGREMNGERGH